MVSAWLKQVGDSVQEHEPLLEISTDKVNLEIPAPAAGRLTEIAKKEGQRVEPGDLLGRIEVVLRQEPAAETQPVSQTSPTPTQQTIIRTEHRLSPAVRRLVKQHGLNPDDIEGTGRGGRVTFRDAERHLQGRPAADKRPAPPPTAPSEPRRIPHTPMRRSIAAHMVESMLHTAPHVTAVFEADLGAVLSHRQAHQEDFERRGVRLTLTSYFVLSSAKALQSVPEVNSRWHDDYLELHAECNIGVATAVEGGLVVPVLRRAQSLDLFEAARSLQEITEKARRNKLQAEDLQGGTFTITNHGVSGSLIATPIIHQPQSAILGLGKLQKRAVVEEVRGADAILIRPMIYVTLTIDHRALDGYQANFFLAKFVEHLESWPIDK